MGNSVVRPFSAGRKAGQAKSTPRIVADPSIQRFASVGDAVRTMRPAMPMYCLHPEALTKNAQLFVRHFPGTTFYAVKANPDPYVLRHLYAAGVHAFDVASLGEVALLRGLFPDATLAFMHPVKAREAIRSAYFDYGVRIFVLDCMDELNKIVEETGGAKDLTLFVRLAMPKGTAVVSLAGKFGAHPDEAVALLKACKQRASRVGMAFHVGQQTLDPESYVVALRLAESVMDRLGFDIDVLDVGGGFPIAGLGDTVKPLLSYFDSIRKGLAAIRLPHGIEIWGEPGRALSGTSATLVVRVELRKGDALYINDGSYGSLFDMCWMGLSNDMTLIRGKDRAGADDAALHPFHFYGPTCASEDHMKGPFMLPADVAEGDWIVIHNMGGYAYVMQTGFNGFRTDLKVEVDGAPAQLLQLKSRRRSLKGGGG